jgi:hypothetical protein
LGAGSEIVTFHEDLARAAIKTVMESVEDVGEVHDYERFADDWDTMVSYFLAEELGDDDDESYLRGWTISLREFEQEQETFGVAHGGGNTEIQYKYSLRGYEAVSDEDESEKSFVTLVLAVTAALDSAGTLHSANREDGANGNFYGPPVSVGRFDFRMFGDVLVHYVELQMVAAEVV